MKTKTQTTNATTEQTGTEFERFREAMKQIISVPKEEIDKREAEYQAKKPTRRYSAKAKKA